MPSNAELTDVQFNKNETPQKTTPTKNYIKLSVVPKKKTLSDFEEVDSLKKTDELHLKNNINNKFDVNLRINMFNKGINNNAISSRQKKTRRLTGYFMKTTPPGIFLNFR